VHLFVGDVNGPLTGEVAVPRSKYHAHRALMLASLAPGTSRIVGVSGARHVRSTIDVLRSLGTQIEVLDDGFVVQGGPYRPRRPSVSVGSSGTTLYFTIGLSALADQAITLTGQKYFQRRPVGPLLEALTRMGIRLQADEARPPITVQPSRPTGGHVSISGTLSQWISGLLLVAPFATGPSVIEVEGTLNEQPYLELTVRMMRQFGLQVDVAEDWRRFEVQAGQEARPTTIEIPPDIGSAAFGLAASGLHPADVVFRGLTETTSQRIDHPEAHFLDVVGEMGLPMVYDEEIGAVRVRHDGIALRGTDIDCRPMPDMLPILATLGAFAHGTTTFDNVAHVRLKESDRVVAMTQLNRMGGSVAMEGDRLIVEGVQRMTGAALSSYNDHRVLMSLAIAASRADGESSLTYPNAFRISYPEFLDDMTALGIPMAIEPPRARRGAGEPTGESVAISQAAEVPLPEWVRRWAQERPADTAIVDVREDGTRAWSWRALDEAADRTAALLLELGVQPGEPVAFQLPNWGEFVVLSVAITRVGAVCCPIMPIFREREIGFALARSRARVLVVAERFRDRAYAAEARALLGGRDDLAVEHVLVVGANGQAPQLPDDDAIAWRDFGLAAGAQAVDPAALAARAPRPDAIGQLLFTSGTTGEPKGVLQRLDALTRAATMEIEHLGLGRDDRIFVPSPLAHQTGFLYGMWVALVLGSGQILQDVWEPTRAARALREWGGSFVQAATPFLTDLVRVVEAGAPLPSALRIFVVTGAAVPRALAERATAVLDAAVCGAWGSTESCLGTLAAPTDDPSKRWGTDGRALDGTQIRITDDAGAVLPAGQEGNFEVFSRCLFEGYLDHPEWTAAALTPDGWYRSGDLATIDEDGFLRITGRVTDVVNRGGEKVPVAEIEQLLHRNPAVEDVAIVAMPDERLGERACAFVVLADGEDAALDLDAVRAYLDGLGVAKQYWPERVEAIDRLPRNPIGKVQKFVLRERAKDLQPTPN
jgi:cyclohexanecarboxylate-CoA ligase